MDTLKLTKTNGDTTEVTAAEYGHYIYDHYEQHDFIWSQDFMRYRRNHVTASLAAKLKAGMDELSCALVDHMEDMYDLLPMLGHVLIQKDAVLTAEDQKRCQLWQQKAANNELPDFYKQLPMFCQPEYVNQYGLYDSNPQVLAYINGKDIIDGGAYMGDTTLLFHEMFPQSLLYAVEPASTNIKYMQERTLAPLLGQSVSQSVSQVPDVSKQCAFTIHAALGEHHDRMTITKPSGHASYSLVLNADHSPNYLKYRNEQYRPDIEEVDIIAIDDLVQERHLNVGLIKFDIEGFEPQAMRGALHTIKTQRPVIISAIYHTPEEYYELKPYLESLDLGYEFKLRYSGSRQPYYEIVLIATPKIS